MTTYRIPIHANIHSWFNLKACRAWGSFTPQEDQSGFEFCYQDTVSFAVKKTLGFQHNGEKRSTFINDYLSLSPQSTNCCVIVLHTKTVKFITASSQWLFWYWLNHWSVNARDKSVSLKSSMRFWHMMILRVFTSTAPAIKKWIIKHILVLNHLLF